MTSSGFLSFESSLHAVFNALTCQTLLGWCLLGYGQCGLNVEGVGGGGGGLEMCHPP